MTKFFPVERYEKRIPMEVAVQIAGHSEMPGVEMTFTENVSARGARVLSSRRWNRDDLLVIGMPRGDFRSPARVAYCHREGEHFAIGLEFLQPEGHWVVDPLGPG
jgi:hypothetical protein